METEEVTLHVTVLIRKGGDPEEALAGVQAALENASGVLCFPMDTWEISSVEIAEEARS